MLPIAPPEPADLFRRVLLLISAEQRRYEILPPNPANKAAETIVAATIETKIRSFINQPSLRDIETSVQLTTSLKQCASNSSSRHWGGLPRCGNGEKERGSAGSAGWKARPTASGLIAPEALRPPADSFAGTRSSSQASVRACSIAPANPHSASQHQVRSQWHVE